MIYQRRHPVIGADCKEFRGELLPLADIDRLERVGQAHFLERDGDLPSIGRWPIIEVKARGGGVGIHGN